jgi:RimJ/RimL family protein N-acetyltransferase
MTPTISTARLTLRPLIKPSSRNLAWLRDPEVVRFSEQRHHEHTLSSQLRYVSSFTGTSRLWAIHLVQSGQHIGNLSAMHDGPNDVADVGIMIGETAYWHKGYAGEAWQATCAWLLDRNGGQIRKLEAGCARTNLAMLKIIQASGFKQEGERLNHFLFDGHPVSAVLFGRTP